MNNVRDIYGRRGHELLKVEYEDDSARLYQLRVVPTSEGRYVYGRVLTLPASQLQITQKRSATIVSSEFRHGRLSQTTFEEFVDPVSTEISDFITDIRRVLKEFESVEDLKPMTFRIYTPRWDGQMINCMKPFRM